MKVLVNKKAYQDRRTAFKELGIDRKYIAQVKKALKDTGAAKIPGFEFVLMAKGTKAATVRVANKVEELLKEKKKGKPAGPPDPDAPDEHCAICARVSFGKIIHLGFKHWRHDACAPGSPSWCEYFAALPRAKQTNEGRLIFDAAQRRKQEVSNGM